MLAQFIIFSRARSAHKCGPSCMMNIPWLIGRLTNTAVFAWSKLRDPAAESLVLRMRPLLFVNSTSKAELRTAKKKREQSPSTLRQTKGEPAPSVRSLHRLTDSERRKQGFARHIKHKEIKNYCSNKVDVTNQYWNIFPTRKWMSRTKVNLFVFRCTQCQNFRQLTQLKSHLFIKKNYLQVYQRKFTEM